MTAYKLIFNDGQKLWSFVTYFTKVEYKLGEITYPSIPNSKLFVFANPSLARRYAFGQDCLYECEVPDLQPIHYIGDYSKLDEATEFWKTRQSKYKLHPDAGYFVTSWVKLIKKLDISPSSS